MVKKQDETRVVHLHLTCLQSLERSCNYEQTVSGLQDRQQGLLAGQLHANDSVSYSTEVLVISDDKAGKVRFRGPYVHGTPTVSFLYLSLRRSDPEQPAWIKRLKIPLPDITWDEITQAPEGCVYAVRVAGTGAGTVSLLDGGWQRQND
ncbi:DUF5990 family protein [Dictyobacter kobayashii]|uniref:Uncharacterized protein n=1 Tax=Dictyobacter kobayashii TaxID=2014872 RepID=A0A402AQB5_9CHLR|nr:DUF5990 family protein [Dictyobacter kobayashii]GCE21282.1 hypothetical protein KDK_50820 [Dictyobacter kobayashii]